METGKAELEHRPACHSDPADAGEKSRPEALALDLDYKSPTSRAQSKIPRRTRDDSG